MPREFETVLSVARYLRIYGISHFGICPILELDGHPNPEIPEWDGAKLRNI
jgi:hypothetical protein